MESPRPDHDALLAKLVAKEVTTKLYWATSGKPAQHRSTAEISCRREVESRRRVRRQLPEAGRVASAY